MKVTNKKFARADENLPIAIARIGKCHGIHGEVKITPYFGQALEGMIGKKVLLCHEQTDRQIELLLESVRGAGKTMIAAFTGIDRPEQIAPFLPAKLTVKKAEISRPGKDKYYYEEIINLPVFDVSGAELGRLTDFFSAGEKDVWQIESKNGDELLVPCLPETIIEVDLVNEKIVIEPMKEFE
jgi:16S rRNA processing protein RimM